MATAGLYSVDHKQQSHPSCDWFIISRMGDSNSLHCHQPFLLTSINLHRKWKRSIAQTRSHRTLEVILPTSRCRDKEYLSNYTVFYYIAISPAAITHCLGCTGEMCTWAVHFRDLALGSCTELWCIVCIRSLMAQDENTIYMTVVAKHPSVWNGVCLKYFVPVFESNRRITRGLSICNQI